MPVTRAVYGIVKPVKAVGILGKFLVGWLFAAIDVEIAGKSVVAGCSEVRKTGHQFLCLHVTGVFVRGARACLQMRNPKCHENGVARVQIVGIIIKGITVNISI